MEFQSCLQKQEQLKQAFANCSSKEMIYQKIISLGKSLSPLPDSLKTEDNLVHGCQSKMYLYTEVKSGKLYFKAEADALISAGLAALLIFVYNEETPECILKCKPTFLKDLDIESVLSPNRANGLYSLHLKMKQEALKALTNKS